MRINRLPVNMGEQLAVRPGNRQLGPGLGPPVAALENPAAPAVRVVLPVLENPVVRAVQVALAVLENPVVRAVRVALAVRENPAVPAALVRQVPAVLARQLVAALLRQVGVPEKQAQTRSVAISRRRAVAAVVPSLAEVEALLKPRAAEVAVA